jgi:hypothetical protein
MEPTKSSATSSSASLSHTPRGNPKTKKYHSDHVKAWRHGCYALVSESPSAVALSSKCHLSLPRRLHWTDVAGGSVGVPSASIPGSSWDHTKRSPRGTSLTILSHSSDPVLHLQWSGNCWCDYSRTGTARSSIILWFRVKGASCSSIFNHWLVIMTILLYSGYHNKQEVIYGYGDHSLLGCDAVQCKNLQTFQRNVRPYSEYLAEGDNFLPKRWLI